MNKIFFILLIISTHFVYAQNGGYREDNELRLNKINQLIDENVATENYQKAADLQKEKSIRLKLNNAYKNNADELKIMQLKSELINCNCTPESLDGEINDLKIQLSEWDNEMRYKNENFVLYTDFLVANFVSTATDVNNIIYSTPYPPYYKEVNERQYGSLLGIGFKIGSSFFFKDLEKGKKLRVGFDLVYFSFMTGLETTDFFPIPTMIILNLPQPGVVLLTNFKKHSGFEARANIGLTKSFGFDLTGMSGRVSLKYWIKKFGVGIDYVYSTSIFNKPINSDRIHQVGLTIGMRF